MICNFISYLHTHTNTQEWSSGQNNPDVNDVVIAHNRMTHAHSVTVSENNVF